MRFLLFSFTLLIFSMFTSCSDDELSEKEDAEFVTPTLTADFDLLNQPRTNINVENGELSWSADDELLVFVHEQGKTPTTTAEWLACRYKFVTDETNCKINKFRPESNTGKVLKINPEKSYEWYVMAPYTETVTSPKGQGSFTISDQTLDFNKSTAHLSNKDVMTCVSHNVKAAENVTLSLKHQTTLMMFRVYNKLGTEFTPSQMQFETKGNSLIPIGGTYAVDFENGLTPVEAEQKMTLSFVNAPVVQTDGHFDVYAIMNPFALTPGEEFHIRVITDKSNSLQTSVMRKDITFKAGTINRANVKVTPLPISSAINPWENQGEIDGELYI